MQQLKCVVEIGDVLFGQTYQKSKVAFVNQINELENQTLSGWFQLGHLSCGHKLLESFQKQTQRFLKAFLDRGEHLQLLLVHYLVQT